MEIEPADENDPQYDATPDTWIGSGFRGEPYIPARRSTPIRQLSWFKDTVNILFAGLVLFFLAGGLSTLAQTNYFHVDLQTLFFMAYACFVWGYASNKHDTQEYLDG